MNKIEQKYLPIIELLEEKSFLESIKNEYKGFITALNPLITKPKILFLGINPGPGAFNEKNKSKNIKEIHYPKNLFSDNKISQIDWLKDGNSRGEFKGKTWKSYKWYERNQKVNNVFVKRLIEFLFTYYNINEKSNYTEIEKKINSDIFYYNLYPISTKTTKELNIILKRIVSEQIILNEKKIKNVNDLKNFFRQRTIDLIKELQPEIIICLGNQSFKDLTSKSKKIDSENPLKKYDIQLRKNDFKKYSIYIVSRNGNWEQRIKNLGKHIKVQ
jgi:hypothetical protein